MCWSQLSCQHFKITLIIKCLNSAYNTRSRKPKGQPIMYNPETLAYWTDKTQDEKTQNKTTMHNKTQKTKKMSTANPAKIPGGEFRSSEWRENWTDSSITK